MTVKRRSGGSTISVTSVKRRVGGAWTTATSVKRRVSGAWVECLSSPLTLSASPTSVYAFDTVSTITSAACTVTASGGTGGTKTYAWDFTSNPLGITALTPSAASTQFRKTSALAGNTYSAVARCTVSDGTNTTSISVPVDIERSGG